MADRTAASLFAEFFNFLAENPDERAKKMARWLLELSQSYDFNTYQMGADEALIRLGLAREEGAGIEYFRSEGQHE